MDMKTGTDSNKGPMSRNGIRDGLNEMADKQDRNKKIRKGLNGWKS